MKNFAHYLTLAAVVAACSPIAQALPTLRIFDGTTTLLITDNAVGDSSATAGRIVWNGSIGNFTLNTDVGTTFPVIGTMAQPALDLSFNAVSNAAGGTLVISFSADGFGPTNSAINLSTGGITQGTTSVAAFGGTNNTLFSVVNPLVTQGPFTNAFSNSGTSAPMVSAGAYALTQQITITHIGTQITTGNSHLTSSGDNLEGGPTVPDSGTSVFLLGVGLMLLAVVARVRPLLT